MPLDHVHDTNLNERTPRVTKYTPLCGTGREKPIQSLSLVLISPLTILAPRSC